MQETTRRSNKILLVDDEPFILSAVASLLRSSGHTVRTCGEWSDVAKAVRIERPDLLLLDYNMPTLKGDDLCAILKRNLVGHETMRIIIFSSEPEVFLRSVAAQCGADGYIKKDVPGPILLAAITSVLSAPV